MSYLFSEGQYDALSTLFGGYFEKQGDRVVPVPFTGYKPTVRERPDGTRGPVDTGKRWLHVALKYPHPQWVREYLAMAHFEACCVARRLGVPSLYMPDVENATLRLLDYPPGTGTGSHLDFNLFTIVCYRSTPFDLQRAHDRTDAEDEEYETIGTQAQVLDTFSAGLHIGELGAMVGLGEATRHWVPERPYRQKSIVYFASPRMDAPLPKGPVTFPAIDGHPEKTVITCGEWQIERTNRSRVYG